MPSSVSLLGPLAALVLVVAAIPLALWLLKRSGLTGAVASMAPGAAPVRLMHSLSLGPAQRIVTVEVGHGEACRWLVVGCTAQGMTALHTLPPGPDAAPAAPAAGGGFAALLERALTRPER